MRRSRIIEDRAHLKILNLVRRALAESPDLENRDLYHRAVDRYEWVGEYTQRQFYGRFVRRARNEIGVKPPHGRPSTTKQAAGKEPEAPTKPTEPRDTPESSRSTRQRTPHSPRPQPRRKLRAQVERPSEAPSGTRGRRSRDDRRVRVRQILVAFAQEVVTAKSDQEIIEVIRQVDLFVDGVLSA